MDSGGEDLVLRTILYYFCNDLKPKIGDFINQVTGVFFSKS